MLKIYHANSQSFRDKYSLEILLEQLPKSLHAKALRYHRAQDAFNFVLGKLMLQHSLLDLGIEASLEDVTFNENEKPTLEGNVFFNISHSGDLVVCGICQDGEIGVDIEKEKVIELANFVKFFTPKEWTDINEHAFPLKKFFWYWVRKESIIKALGVNLSYLNKIELEADKDFFIENEKQWFLKDLYFDEGYFFAICSEVNYESVEIFSFE